MEGFAEHEKGLDIKELKVRLVNTVCASMIAEPRFDKDDDSGAGAVVALVEQVAQHDPEFVLKLAVYVRNDLNIRSTANFLVALAANSREASPFLRKYFRHIMRLPSDWLDVAALYQLLPNRSLKGRALPTALRKAMQFKFPEFDTYQLGKYNKQGKLKRKKKKEKKAAAAGKPLPSTSTGKGQGGKSDLTLKQMVRQLHINAPVFHVMCLLGKKYPTSDTEFRRSGLPGMFEPARAGTRLKLPVPETWETLLSAKGNKAETWEELIEHRKLPFMAMLRNLRNLILAGVDHKYHRWAMNKLNNEVAVAKSRQFPFAFFSAYEAIDIDLDHLRQEIKEAKQAGAKTGERAPAKKVRGAPKAARGRGGKPEPADMRRPKRVIVPKNMPDEALIKKYKEALDNAVKFATVHNVKPIRGSTVVFCSVADSMKTSPCKNARGMGSVRTLQDVGVLLGLMCKYMCEECDFRIFSSAAPGYDKCHLPVELKEGTVLDNMKVVADLAASGALASATAFPFDYLEDLIRERKVIDNFIVLSDTMLGPGFDEMTHINSGGLSGILKKYRQEVNPDLLFVSVNLSAAGRSIDREMGDRHPNDVMISGFSDAILKYVAERGDSNQLHYIEHIDEEKNIKEPPPRSQQGKKSLLSFSTASTSNPFRSRMRVNLNLNTRRKSFWDDDEEEPEKAQADAAKEELRKKEELARQLAQAAEQEAEEIERAKRAEHLEKMRSGKWRTARLFVSSTFRDMHGERDHLVRFIFPELRERCKKRKITFYDVDLRWGVTQDEAEETGALDICLNEVDRCRPFFLGVLGERYGWTLDNYKLPDEPRYLWAKNYPKGRSITELEMYYGALKNPDDAQAFFYFRRPGFEQAIEDEAVREVFQSEGKDATHKIQDLKGAIQRTFPTSTRNYTPTWGGIVDGKPMTANLEEFGQAVLNDLWGAISRSFAVIDIPTDPLSIASDYHHTHLHTHVSRWVGREDLLKQLYKFADGDDLGPFVVAGDPGSGKSALLAQFAHCYAARNSNAFVLSHFVGAAPESTDIRHTLFRLANELRNKFHLTEPIPEDYKDLRQAFPSILEDAAFSTSTKIVIVIDALNQLSEKERAHSLDWLPSVSRVRIVVSTYVQAKSYDVLRYRKPPAPTLVIPALTEVHGKELVTKTLWEFRKKLDDSPGNNQMRFLLKKTDASKPLFLVVACEELRVFGLYEKLTSKIKNMASTVPKLFEEVLQRLETDQDKDLLKTTLSVIGCSRDGLLEAEITRILARERKKEVELPSAAWSPLFASLKPFLRPLGDAGEGVLAFFHAQMELAVRKRYLHFKNQELKSQKLLADFFFKQACQRRDLLAGSQSGSAKRFERTWTTDRRAISELPYHLIKAQMWSELEEVLCDLNFVKLKCEVGLAYDLLADLTEATNLQHNWEGKQRIVEFHHFVSENVHILSEHPELTFQQAANQPDGSAPAEAALALMAVSAGPKSGWIKWLNKPQRHGACMMTLSGNAEPAMACAFSPDGSQIVIASRDQTLRICDAITGLEISTLAGHTNWVVACAYSPDGSRIVSASWDSTLKVWDARAGVECASLTGHTRRVNACAFSNDGRKIVSGAWDCTVKIWDSYSGKELKTMYGHTKPINSVAFSPDDSMIVTASWDCTVKLWDAVEGKEMSTLAGHTKSVRSVQFSPTGNQVVSTSVDTTVKVWDVRTGQVMTNLVGHSKPVNACAFSADGKHLVSASDDLTVKVWDALGGREVSKLASLTDGGVWATTCDFSPNQRKVVTAFSDCTVGIWDVFSGELALTIKAHTRTINACLFSPDGAHILTASDDGTLRIWDAQDGRMVRTLEGHKDAVNDACFSADGTMILSASDDYLLLLWDSQTGAVLQTMKGHTNRVTGCAFAPDGKRIASASRDNTLRIWDPRTGNIKKIMRGHLDWLIGCLFTPDSKKLISSSWDFNLKLWDVRQGCELATLKGHMGAISSISVSADGKQIVSGSLDGTIKIWDTVERHEITTITSHTKRVNSVKFAKKGTVFVSCSDDGTIRMWDAEAGQEVTSFQGHSETIRQVRYNPQKNQVVSASDDCTVKVWNADAEREISGHAQWVNACAISRDGKLLVTASRDHTLKLWDTRTNRARATFEGHTKSVNGCDISPDGTRLVSASDDFTLILWDTKTGEQIKVINNHKNAVRSCCFSPDGRQIASASWDNTVCLYDARTGNLQKTLSGHTDWVNAVAYSPDGTKLVSASHDQSLIIWDCNGYIIKTLTGHTNWVTAVAFAPNGSEIVSASYDSTLKVWNAATGREVASFKDGHCGKRINACAFSPDGRLVLSGGADGLLRSWRSGGQKDLKFYCKAPVTALAVANSVCALGDSLGNIYTFQLSAW